MPFTGTRDWTAGLGLPIEFPWRPWKLGRQVAGHAVRYRAEGEGPLTFATVMGAGHMVPAGGGARARARRFKGEAACCAFASPRIAVRDGHLLGAAPCGARRPVGHASMQQI